MNIFLITLILVFVLVAIMEIFRRLISKLKKAWLKTTILTTIGLVFSFLIATLAYFAFPAFSAAGSPISILLYGFGLFFAQKDLDLSVLKPIINKIVKKGALNE